MASGTISAQNSNLNSGVPTPGSVIQGQLNGTQSAINLFAQGTWTGTLIVQISSDGQDWITVLNTNQTNVADGTTGAITGNGSWTVPVSGSSFRISSSGAWTGAALVNAVPFAAGTSVGGGGGSVPNPIGVTSTDGALATIGTTTNAAVVTDANGTVIGFLRGLVKLIAAGISTTLTGPLGRALASASLPVVLNSDQDTVATGTITVADSGGGTTTGKYFSGATTGGSTYPIPANGKGCVTFEVAGGLPYTLIVEATNDTNASAALIRWNSPLTVYDGHGNVVSSITGDGTYTLVCPGMTQWRLRCTTFTSTITLYSVATAAPIGPIPLPVLSVAYLTTSSAGDTTIVAAAGAGLKIYVADFLVNTNGVTNVQFKDDAGGNVCSTLIYGPTAGAGVSRPVVPIIGTYPLRIKAQAVANKPLVLNNSAAIAVSAEVWYWVAP